jgi:hypothetical protein
VVEVLCQTTTLLGVRDTENSVEIQRNKDGINVANWACPELSSNSILRRVYWTGGSVKRKASEALMILIAGPYRSGTDDDPELIRKNVALMESYAEPIFRAGHIPMLGEWLALPLAALAGSKTIGDEAFNEVFHPVAARLLEKCDAVLRVGGASAGADEMVRVGETLGLRIYKNVRDMPGMG